MNKDKIIEYVINLIYRCLFMALIFLVVAIFSKSNSSFKNYIVSNVYENDYSFVKMKDLYDKYLGGIFPLEKMNNTSPVFNETIEYKNISKYYDGVKLEVTSKYLVPSLKDGMITFVGEKENYGNVIIVTTIDDVNIWYGNLGKSAVKLYDYVSKGDYLGEVMDNTLYMIFSKDNNYLDYKEFLDED